MHCKHIGCFDLVGSFSRPFVFRIGIGTGALFGNDRVGLRVLPPAVLAADLRRLYDTLLPRSSEVDELARYARNSGYVEKIVVGTTGAQGRVRGRRRDTGFNVRVWYSGRNTCRCARSRKEPCEHVGALLLQIIPLLEEAAAGGRAIPSAEPAPSVIARLVEVAGIGERRAVQVARVFRTLDDLRSVRVEELQNLPEVGRSTTARIHAALAHGQEWVTPRARMVVEPDLMMVRELVAHKVGLGRARAMRIAAHFPTMSALRGASLAEIRAVPSVGEGTARKLIARLEKGGRDDSGG